MTEQEHYHSKQNASQPEISHYASCYSKQGR